MKMYLQSHMRKRAEYNSRPLFFIEIENKSGTKNRIEIFQFEASIGRSKDNDIVINDIFVSRHHAKVQLNSDNTFTLSALKKYNGIVVDGEEKKAFKVRSHQMIKLGDTYLSFALPEITQNDPIEFNHLETVAKDAINTNEDIAKLEPFTSDQEKLKKIDAIERTSTIDSHDDEASVYIRADQIAEETDDNVIDGQALGKRSQAEEYDSDAPTQFIQTDESNDDEDEDANLPPAYSLRERLFNTSAQPIRGELAWEVIRYRDEQIFEIFPLKVGAQRVLGGKTGPKVKVGKDGQLSISKFNGRLCTHADPQQSIFEPASMHLRSNLFGWAPSPNDVFHIEFEGVYYLLRKTRIPEIALPETEFEIPEKYYYISGGIGAFHLIAIIALSLFSSPVPEAVQTEALDLNRFAQVAINEVKPTPNPTPKAPQPEPKKVTTTLSEKKVRTPRRPTNKQRFQSRKPSKSASNKVADISQVGALGKLGGTGLFSKTKSSSNQLLAAASNVSAVRAKGGVQTFSVTGNITGMPGKEIRMASISPVGKIGGSPKGNGFGAASVGAKTNRKIKGTVVDLSPPSGEVGVKGGGLTRAEIAKVVQEHLSEIRYCYEKGLLDDPALSGKITAKWTISPGGSVVESGIKSSSVQNSSVHRCLTSQIRSWGFPRPRDGSSVLVTFPFVFSSSSF